MIPDLPSALALPPSPVPTRAIAAGLLLYLGLIAGACPAGICARHPQPPRGRPGRPRLVAESARGDGATDLAAPRRPEQQELVQR